MKYFSRHLFCALLLFALWQVTPCQSLPKPDSKPFNQAGEDANFQQYLTSGRITVVAFYANWCPSCRSWVPVLETVNSYFPDMQVVFMDIGEWDTPVADKYGIESIPHLKIYNGDGKFMVEGPGAKDWLRQAIGQRLMARAQGKYRLTSDGARFDLNNTTRIVSTRPRNRRTTSSARTPTVAVNRREKIDATGTLPTIDQVLDRYMTAVGGSNSAPKFETRSARGKVSISTMGRGTFAMHFKVPNKVVATIDIPEVGVIKTGFNGAAGWSQGPRTGVRPATESELATLKRDADFYSCDLKARYLQIKLLGATKIGYREAYVIEAKPSGGLPEKLYFSKENGLLIRWDVIQVAAGMKTMAEIYLDDWTMVDGQKIPFTITHLFPRLSIVYSIDEVKHDVELNDVVFNRPGTK